MSSESQAPEVELPLGRLEAFSDGVFAIAVTILVLELSVDASAEHDLLEAILDEWPSYLAYVTSFFTIGAIWIQHSTVTGALRTADGTLYRLNLVVLLLASFIPFPTKLVAEFVGDRDPEQIAVVFYGLTLLLLDLAMIAFVRYAVEHRRLIKDHIHEEEAQAALDRQPNYGFYVAAIVVGYLFPTFGVVFYLVIALRLGVPLRTIRRVLRRR